MACMNDWSAVQMGVVGGPKSKVKPIRMLKEGHQANRDANKTSYSQNTY